MSTAAELEDRLAYLESLTDGLASAQDLDTAWIIWCGILVFLMQVGFSMLEVGSISPKNTKAVLIKNLTDAALGAICWWTLGHGFAYGNDVGGFIGTDSFAFSGNATHQEDGQGAEIAQWFFEWAFAATAATVVSGAVAERIKIAAYVQLSVLITFLIYPVVVHWVWSEGGWASPRRCEDTTTAVDYQLCREESRGLLLGCGATDFAGAGVVHMTGGMCALVAAKIVGPRTKRFRNGIPNRMPQQSPALQTLGVLILWVGWYGFNGGSVGSVSNGRSHLVAAAMVNTTISAAASVLSVGLWLKIAYKKVDSGHLNNGILSGLVAISASGSLVQPEGAFIIGAVASAFYMLGTEGLKWFRIDDVVQASAVHLMCGAWGLVSVGLFSTGSRYQDVYSYGIFSDPERDEQCCGLLYGCGGKVLAANVILILSISGWVAALAFLGLLVIKKSVGLRVPLVVEEMGMDKSRHTRSNRNSTALRRALRSAAGKDDRSTAASSHRPSFKSAPVAASPRTLAPVTLSHWKE
ncbi:unnamed protein product [Ectocarpus sp. CCAP 1310/34]|nr:unnamed protein product [Ectocarpus sp. CCAP 1310/34]